MTKNNKPKILIYDIETSLMLMAGFGIWDQNINLDHILEDWHIISIAWKWLGEKKVHAVSTNTRDDSEVCKKFFDVLMEADVIVAHNGDRFDIKKLETRFIKNGTGVLPKIKSIDTLKIVKQRFKFTSNRLDYVAKFLGVGAKMETTKGLWMDVLRGSKKAVREMVKYNKVDVIVLEAVYNKLLPYIDGHLNHNMYTTDSVCRNCGGKHLTSRGYTITKSGKYRRLQCQGCGTWMQEKKNFHKTSIK